MAGMLAMELLRSGQPGFTPEQVFADPYMRESNPIMDLLIAHYQHTKNAPRKTAEKPEPTPVSKEEEAPQENRMRATKGPIQAKAARRYAMQRDRIMREIE